MLGILTMKLWFNLIAVFILIVQICSCASGSHMRTDRFSMRFIHPKSHELVRSLNVEGKLELKGHMLYSGHPHSFDGTMAQEKFWVEDFIAIGAEHIDGVFYKSDEPIIPISPLEYEKYRNFLKKNYPDYYMGLPTYEEYLEEAKKSNYTVYLTFTDIGTRKFAEVTSQNINRNLAIILDGLVFARPVIIDGIFDGKAAIYSSTSEDEAKRITEMLSGATQHGHTR